MDMPASPLRAPLHKPTMPYRADIDGLRALAVLSVIIFHLSPGGLRGGFTGVDIFFVISGYLITGLLWSDPTTERSTILTFYTRRIKRILPACISVSLVTTIASLYFLPPNALLYYAASLQTMWLFASNIFFSMLSTDYFAARTAEFPLLHTWSLGVEEQFYFIFPIFLLLIKKARIPVISILVPITMIFLLFSDSASGTAAGYYLPQYRAHQLLAGSITYFIVQHYPLATSNAARSIGLLGIIVMLLGLFCISSESAYPGLLSLIPTVGTVLTLYAGSKNNIVSNALQNRILVGIGLMSFSLYLWHWPILVFLRLYKINISAAITCAYLVSLFVLSYLSWRYIELPVRKQQRLTFFGAGLRYYVLPSVVVVLFSVTVYFTNGLPGRYNGELRELMTSYSNERDLSRRCSVRPGDFTSLSAANLTRYCSFGEMAQLRPSILLYGDSHASHFRPMVDVWARDAGLKAVYSVMNGCTPVALNTNKSEGLESLESCVLRNEEMKRIFGEYEYVVLGGAWNLGSDPMLWEKQMMANVADIVAAKAIPVILLDSPRSDIDMSECIMDRMRGWIPEEETCDIPIDMVHKWNTKADETIYRVASIFRQTIVIDPKKMMCDKNVCHTYMGNIAYYRDKSHLNEGAARRLGQIWLQEFDNPLAH